MTDEKYIPSSGIDVWHEHYETIFMALPIGISFLTKDLRYIRINPFLEAKLRVESKEIEGLHCYEVAGMYKKDPTRTGTEKICEGCGVVKAIATGQKARFIRHVGQDFIAENIALPIKNSDGEVIGAVEIILDITKTVETEERLQNYENFITMLTHDLKAPLTSIIGYSSLLLDDGFCKLDGPAKASVEGINDNAHRMLNLARSFLTAGKIQETMLNIEPTPMQLDNLVKDSLKALEPLLKAKDIEVILRFNPDLPHAPVDRDYMERVITNIVSNAIKFTSEGGRITIDSRLAPDGHVILDIHDNGMGISKEELPNLFDKYYHGERAGGTGLGLFIAKNIVHAHQGEIRVKSELGAGTTFTIKLPSELSA